MTEKPEIKSMNLKELTEFVVRLGEKPFRAKQLYQWMHQKLSASFDEMTNLSVSFRETLKQTSTYTVLKRADVQISNVDGTRKYLFLLEDGNVVESVLMRYKYGNSVCISSQAGCRMGCRFCASAIGGLKRNLLPSEMLEQIYRIQTDTKERVSNVVVMGTGEPLDNYDNLLKFIELITNEEGLNISQRNLTVSTCGIVPNIRKLAEEKLQITLALSLHASSQKKRKELMPVAAKYDIYEVIGACQYYFEQTGRRITFEYSLAEGINDTEEDAKALAELVSGINCHVNLIPINPVKEREFVGSSQAAAKTFRQKLEANRINATIRRETGRDIDAACGQLRRKYIETVS